MRDFRYEIPIYRHNSPRAFKLACQTIEQAFPGIKKDELLIDVDGSMIQQFYYANKRIIVYDDYDVGAVFALSDIDFSYLFDVDERSLVEREK